MLSAGDILDGLWSSGFRVAASDGDLIIDGPVGKLDDQRVGLIRENKAGILALLVCTSGDWTAPTVANIESPSFGWSCAEYIGGANKQLGLRKSIWANPFVIGLDGNRDEVMTKYRQWILQQDELLDLLPTLYGKMLACWCHPDPCHGDILAHLCEHRIECEREREAIQWEAQKSLAGWVDHRGLISGEKVDEFLCRCNHHPKRGTWHELDGDQCCRYCGGLRDNMTHRVAQTEAKSVEAAAPTLF